MGDSCVWTCFVPFVAIQCWTKTGASFFFFFVVPPISFPQGHFFFSLRGASFTAVEICILEDNFHAWSSHYTTSTPEHISEKKGPSPAGFLQILLSGCLFWGGRGRGSECWHRCGCGWCWMAMVGHGICGKVNALVEISTYLTFQCNIPMLK